MPLSFPISADSDTGYTAVTVEATTTPWTPDTFAQFDYTTNCRGLTQFPDELPSDLDSFSGFICNADSYSDTTTIFIEIKAQYVYSTLAPPGYSFLIPSLQIIPCSTIGHPYANLCMGSSNLAQWVTAKSKNEDAKWLLEYGYTKWAQLLALHNQDNEAALDVLFNLLSGDNLTDEEKNTIALLPGHLSDAFSDEQKQATFKKIILQLNEKFKENAHSFEAITDRLQELEEKSYRHTNSTEDYRDEEHAEITVIMADPNRFFDCRCPVDEIRRSEKIPSGTEDCSLNQEPETSSAFLRYRW